VARRPIPMRRPCERWRLYRGEIADALIPNGLGVELSVAESIAIRLNSAVRYAVLNWVDRSHQAGEEGPKDSGSLHGEARWGFPSSPCLLFRVQALSLIKRGE